MFSVFAVGVAVLIAGFSYALFRSDRGARYVKRVLRKFAKPPTQVDPRSREPIDIWNDDGGASPP